MQRHGRGGRPLLYLVLEVILTHDLDVHPVLAGDVALLLEQDGGVPGRRKYWESAKYKKQNGRHFPDVFQVGLKFIENSD